jgi:hypothetical protein
VGTLAQSALAPSGTGLSALVLKAAVELSENSTFARVIHEMARIDGARWWVDANGNFNYVPYGSPQGIYSITINQNADPIAADCVELRVHHNLQAGRPLQVTVKGLALAILSTFTVQRSSQRARLVCLSSSTTILWGLNQWLPSPTQR